MDRNDNDHKIQEHSDTVHGQYCNIDCSSYFYKCEFVKSCVHA